VSTARSTFASAPEAMPGDLGDVLCVEDDPVVQIALGDVVRRAGACQHTAASAREAEAHLEHRTFDLIVLDRRLPDSDGLLLIQTIRRASDCPVIVLSRMGDTQDRILGLGLGATEYVTKPFSPADLSSRIRFMLMDRARQRASDRSQPITRGRLSFLPLSRRLTIDGAAVFLPPAEARLLLVLLENEGEVLTRDDLTQAACGRDWSPGDRTVDVLIARVRKRIPPNVAEIVTVHRTGYLLTIAPKDG